MAEVSTTLLELFRAHDIDSILEGEWVVFPGRQMKARASIVQETAQRVGMSVQLDVRLEIAPRRAIIESFAGLGETRESAIEDAIKNFTLNTFHVLLKAFFLPEDDKVSQEQWSIGGHHSLVTIGNVGIRGKPPVHGKPLLGWFEQLERKIKEKPLVPGTHWVRLYYAQNEGKPIILEILLDNQAWEEMQSDMAGVEWPSGDAFYSLRIFLVLQTEKRNLLTPEGAVAQLADIVDNTSDLSEDTIYQAMADAGIPRALADRAFKLTQTAWGRELLAGLGIRFSPDYLCLNASGEVVESGRLADEPCFIAATQLEPLYSGSPGYQRLALTSAEVSAVNQSLHAGSRSEDLITAPVCLFLEPPTEAGMENARRIIAEHLQANRPTPPDQGTPPEEQE